MALLTFLLLFAAPLGLHAAYWWQQDHPASWAAADWGSTRTLPPASMSKPAMVRVYAARTGRWKGVFATHSWIVLKDQAADGYERWDKVGWGHPVRRNNYAPDGRWYGNDPELVYEIRGAEAARLIPVIRANIANYAFNGRGAYRIWPGPNSNTFVASVLATIPELAAALPPTAIGKDYPFDGRWFAPTPSGTGYRLSLAGYAGMTLAWVEGVELSLLGAVVGLDFQYPAVKLPGFGRLGLPRPVTAAQEQSVSRVAVSSAKSLFAMAAAQARLRS